MNIAKQPSSGDSQRLKEIKRQLFQLCRTCKGATKRIKAHVEAAGKANLETELAGDSAELDAAYQAVKTLITTLDPTATVDDLE